MASQLDLSKVKDLDYKTKLVIYGYFRKHDNEFLNKIPEDIKLICLLFYGHYMNDYFDPENTGKNLIVSKDRLIITRITDYNSSHSVICGDTIQDISPLNSIYNKYIWHFKYTNLKNNDTFIAFYVDGIDIDESENSEPPWLYLSSGYMQKLGDALSNVKITNKSYREQIKCGDIIIIELDINNKMIQFTVNNDIIGSFKNIPFTENSSYKLMIGLQEKDDCCKLLSFQQIKIK